MLPARLYILLKPKLNSGQVYRHCTFQASKILYLPGDSSLLLDKKKGLDMGLILFFGKKQFSAEKGRKRPLDTSLLTRNVAAAANTYQDKKARAVIFCYYVCMK